MMTYKPSKLGQIDLVFGLRSISRSVRAVLQLLISYTISSAIRDNDITQFVKTINVCVCVCIIRRFIFITWIHLQRIQVKFVCQGHQVKVKVTGGNKLCLCCRHLQSKACESWQSLIYVCSVMSVTIQ